MSDESKGISLVNAELPESVDNAVKNLTDKPTLSIGQTMADLWDLALGGRVAFAAEKQRLRYAHELEEYRRELDAKVAAIPAEKQIEPSLQIAAQALDDSKYCVESEELRKMFSSLIANSMNVDYTNQLHPSFSGILRQMSPTDAQMLQLFQQWNSHGGIAIVNYIRKLNNDGFETLAEFVPAVAPADCSSESAVRSIISLQRLGLIQVPEDRYFVDESRYAWYSETEIYSTLKTKSVMLGYKLDIQKHLAKLTPLGKDFVSVCLG